MVNKKKMKFKDNDMSREARDSRYNEYMGLRGLPFYSREQSLRLNRLQSLRVRDNRFAFDQGRVAQ